MKKIFCTTIVSMLLFAAAAIADSGLYVIPFANHIERGTTGTEATDISIFNPNSSPLTVDLLLIEYGLHNVFENVFPITTVTIPAGGTRTLRDVLSDFNGQENTIGAILVASEDERPFAVSSRSYITREDGSTVGYAVPANADSLRTAGDGSIYLPGLMSNGRYRSQVGFVAATTDSALFFEFILKDAEGTTIGSRPFFIGPGQLVSLEVPITSLNAQQFDVASVEVRILVGQGVLVPYAKLIDTATFDTVFVSGSVSCEPSFLKQGSPSILRGFFKGIAHQ